MVTSLLTKQDQFSTNGIWPFKWRPQWEYEFPLLREDLIGYWDTKHATSATLRDISGYGSHGTLTNMTASDWVISNNPRLPGYALAFDGNTKHVDFGSSALFDDAEPFTVLFWHNPATFTQGDQIIGKGPGSGLWTIELFSNARKSIRFFKDTADPNLQAEWNATANLNTDSFIAISWDGGMTAATALTCHLNGVLVSQNSATNGGGAKTDNTLSLKIGDASASYDGQVRFFIMYNRVLLKSEIIKHYLDPYAVSRLIQRPVGAPVAVAGGRIMSSLVNGGGLAGYGGIAGKGGGLAG